DAAEDVVLPVHYAADAPPGWWGMAWTIAADVSLFASLVFAFLYLWTANAAWPPPGFHEVGWALPALALAALAAGRGFVHFGMRAGRRDDLPKLQRFFAAAFAMSAAFVALVAAALFGSELSAHEHAYGAVVFALWGCAAIHSALAMVMVGFAF